tara:strand:+ start:186 stop:1043 length:858 start_codon:yes stop_codon:yes gene_type:complete
MIYVRIRGGLGNQLFQYCSARSLADRLNVNLGLDTREYNANSPFEMGLNHFNIRAEINPKGLIKHKKNGFLKYILDIASGNHKNVYKETNLDFNNLFVSLPDNTYLKGYWQSEKYFEKNRKNIFKDLQIIESQSKKNKKISQNIDKTNSVSLHIRRGDYVTNTAYNIKHGTCSLDYYKKSVDYLNKSLNKDFTIFVFSDDPEWAFKNLKLPMNIQFIKHNPATKNYEDLRLMSECKHNIIANSSFSWWGAWLNKNPKKTIISPKEWYADKNIKNIDIIPKNWIRI